MQNRITLLLLAILLGLPILSIAQNGAASISGKVTDPEDAPVSFANVVLYKTSDTSIAKVEVTDDQGVFQILGIPAGQYQIEVSYVGLPPYRSEIFDLAEGAAKKLSTIRMQKQATELKEVVVTAERPLLELKPDKMVLNVENTINAVGNNGLELLSKSPGVLVDGDDNISMLGRTGVRIYIDGKPSPLRGADLGAYLRSMQSTDIEAIEIITNPGSKYEADGNAGIINIRLKKDKNLGGNVNTNLGYSIGQLPRYNGSISGNYRNKAMNLFGNYSFNDGRNISFMQLYREQLGLRFDQNNNNGGHWQGHNFKAGADVFLSKNSTVGVMVDGNLSENSWHANGITDIGAFGSATVDSILVARSRDQGNRDNLNLNLNYRFDNTKGLVWNLDADYGLYRNDASQYQPNVYMDPTGQVIFSQNIVTNRKPTDIDIYSFKIDHERNIGKGKLGAGVKLSYVETDNTFQFFNVIDGQEVINPNRSNNFVYQENVNAAYLNYSQQFKKFGYQLGLRTEHTHSLGDLTSLQQTGLERVERDYVDFFPSVSFSFTPNQKNSFQLSYGRRINRPSYQNLNPFQDQLDELTYQQGNPFLRPEYTDNIQLTHSFNYRINTTLKYSRTTDMITEQTDIASNDQRASYITFLNVAQQDNYSINLSAPLPLAKWWNSYTSVTGYYTRNQGDFGEGKIIDLSAKALNLYSQHTFQLPGDFSMELSGWYNSPSLWGGNFEMDAMWSMNAGLQKRFMGGKANLKLSVNDIFLTNQWNGASRFGQLLTMVSGGWDSRRFGMNLSYMLGNNQVKSRRRSTGLEDEQRRVGSGEGN